MQSKCPEWKSKNLTNTLRVMPMNKMMLIQCQCIMCNVLYIPKNPWWLTWNHKSIRKCYAWKLISCFVTQMYLQKRFTWRGSKLLRHGIQFILLLLAWYTVMTRISDYKHHWSDVLAGFGIGLLFAIVIVSKNIV